MIKYAVSLLLKRDDEFLIVKRRKDEKEHPGMWGFPAISFTPPETPENALKRLANEKLGCGINIKGFIGAMHQRRPNYELILLMYEAEAIGNPVLKKEKYEEIEWTREWKRVLDIAKKGSACAQIFLNKIGILKEEEFIKVLDESMLSQG